jgi:hypothetical protein
MRVSAPLDEIPSKLALLMKQRGMTLSTVSSGLASKSVTWLQPWNPGHVAGRISSSVMKRQAIFRHQRYQPVGEEAYPQGGTPGLADPTLIWRSAKSRTGLSWSRDSALHSLGVGGAISRIGRRRTNSVHLAQNHMSVALGAIDGPRNAHCSTFGTDVGGLLATPPLGARVK